MIAGRVYQQHLWNRSFGRRYLFSYAQRTPLSSPAAFITEKTQQPLGSSYLLTFSSFVSTRFRIANSNVIGCGIRYQNVNRCCFSSQALADSPVAGIVDVPLAQTGEGIAECELLQWFVQEGDEVEEFQPLCQMQSDKATIDITSRYKGKVAQVLYVPGDIVKVGETLLRMAVEGSHASIPRQDGLEDTKSLGLKLEKSETGGILSTPAVRHFAKQHGINLSDVHGTGDDGRILKEDVLGYGIQKGVIKDSLGVTNDDTGKLLAGEKEKTMSSSTEVGQLQDDKTIPLRGFQRTMVKTMSMAAKVPHFHYVEEINCNALVEIKESLQNNSTDPGIKYTFLPLLIKSLSMALTKYPWMNSCFNEESIEVILKGSHNIGIAMATPRGLVVPNIKNVQSLSIFEITKELARLQQLSSENRLSPEDITGGTITLSNIGAIGGKFGAPIINLPEVAIIAIGRIQKVPQFAEDGNVYPASIMTVNVGADHRVLDGATVARFCNEWKRFIEKPELLMLLLR